MRNKSKGPELNLSDRFLAGNELTPEGGRRELDEPGSRLVFSSGEMLPASTLGGHPAPGHSPLFMRIIRAASIACRKSSPRPSESSVLSLLRSSFCGNMLQAHFPHTTVLAVHPVTGPELNT